MFIRASRCWSILATEKDAHLFSSSKIDCTHGRAISLALLYRDRDNACRNVVDNCCIVTMPSCGSDMATCHGLVDSAYSVIHSTPCLKKVAHRTLPNIFAQGWPIVKISTATESEIISEHKYVINILIFNVPKWSWKLALNRRKCFSMCLNFEVMCNKIMFKEHRVCPMSSLTSITRYFYANISGWQPYLR